MVKAYFAAIFNDAKFQSKISIDEIIKGLQVAIKVAIVKKYHTFRYFRPCESK